MIGLTIRLRPMNRPPRVRFVGPKDTVKRPRPTLEENGLKHQMSQFYSLKSTMEQLFGNPMYLSLKETTDFTVWRKAMKKLLSAVDVSVKASIKVADDDFYQRMERVIDKGKQRVANAETTAELFAGLTATLSEVVFTQLGFMPTRSTRDKMVPLSREYWSMNNFRTVQYVQTPEQRKALKEYTALLAARRAKAQQKT